jgi:DNA-binding XRE family transcriptional regulator
MERPLIDILPVSDDPLAGYSPYFASVSAKMRAIRRHKGFNQLKMASELNVSRLTYGRYESNPALMPLSKVVDFITFFNIKIIDILE